MEKSKGERPCGRSTWICSEVGGIVRLFFTRQAFVQLKMSGDEYALVRKYLLIYSYTGLKSRVFLMSRMNYKNRLIIK